MTTTRHALPIDCWIEEAGLQSFRKAVATHISYASDPAKVERFIMISLRQELEYGNKIRLTREIKRHIKREEVIK